MLIFLKGCGNYQLTFNNLNFSLTEDELIGFANYLKRIDIDYWEKEYEHSIYKKKIPIPSLQSNFIILINRLELYELLVLLNFENTNKMLSYNDLKNEICWNWKNRFTKVSLFCFMNYKYFFIFVINYKNEIKTCKTFANLAYTV